MKKKIIAALASLIVGISLIAPQAASAQEARWWAPTYQQFTDKVDGAPTEEIFGERYTAAQVNWIVNSFIYMIGGPVAACASSSGFGGAAGDTTNDSTLGGDPTEETSFTDCLRGKGVLGASPGPILTLAGTIDTVRENRPASGIDYVTEKLNNFNLIPAAYAQGYGYNQALLPIRILWVTVRNAAYGLLVLVTVAFAFLIMFRAKISPQAVVTIQSAIPRIAIAAIVITFSYAIAGFLVDLAYVIQGLIATLISANLSTAGTSPLEIFALINDGVGSMLNYAVAFIFQSFSPGGGILGQAINGGPADILVNGIFAIFDLILALIVLILLLIALLRIFWILIITYAKTIFIVIASPFAALLAAVQPGGSILGWIRGLVAQLSVFVTVGIVIMLGHVLFWGFGNGAGFSVEDATDTLLGWNINTFNIRTDLAPAGSGTFPSGFNFGNNTQAIGFFVSLAVMLSVPKIANSVRDFIATGKAAFGFDTAGEIVGGGAGRMAFGLGAAAEERRLSILEQSAKNLGKSPWELGGKDGREYIGRRIMRGIMGAAAKQR